MLGWLSNGKQPSKCSLLIRHNSSTTEPKNMLTFCYTASMVTLEITKCSCI